MDRRIKITLSDGGSMAQLAEIVAEAHELTACRARMRRYPRVLAHLKDKWWEDDAHLEMLAAMVVWRASIDAFGRDPRKG